MARDRLEMVLLSAAGRSPPKIAAHLGRHPHANTVRSLTLSDRVVELRGRIERLDAEDR